MMNQPDEPTGRSQFYFLLYLAAFVSAFIGLIYHITE